MDMDKLTKTPAGCGWKTWIAAAGLALLALADVLGGEVEAALAKFSGALGLIGLGQAIGKRGEEEKKESDKGDANA